MFTPYVVRGVTLPNRIVVSPMAMYSAADGDAERFPPRPSRRRAPWAAPALVFGEMTCVSPDARITPGCLGLWNDEQAAGWKRIVDFVHANSAAKFGIQLGHAGRKGSTKLAWEGIDQPLRERQLAADLGLADSLPQGEPGPEGDGPRRHGSA